jgi:putative DNA primase/helicase
MPTNAHVENVFQSPLAQRYTFQSGTLAEWQDNVSRKCSGNSRLVFMVSAAFAAPLMPFANAESGGFNFIGPASSGKTTGALVATSVMSNKKYMQNWRATSNGLEAIAAQYNHALLPLDEIAQADAKSIGEMVYMLANSRGKMRMAKTGTLRSTYEWQNTFLSTGEKDLT